MSFYDLLLKFAFSECQKEIAVLKFMGEMQLLLPSGPNGTLSLPSWHPEFVSLPNQQETESETLRRSPQSRCMEKKEDVSLDFVMKKCKKATTPGIPRRSPIQVLTWRDRA